jgi:hypothetical protein
MAVLADTPATMEPAGGEEVEECVVYQREV